MTWLVIAAAAENDVESVLGQCAADMGSAPDLLVFLGAKARGESMSGQVRIIRLAVRPYRFERTVGALLVRWTALASRILNASVVLRPLGALLEILCRPMERYADEVVAPLSDLELICRFFDVTEVDGVGRCSILAARLRVRLSRESGAKNEGAGFSAGSGSAQV